MRIGFWHPFGSHADESREEILKRKSKEINENGWTLWSFQYRTPETIAVWREEIEILKPSKVLVFCSDSPKAKPPKSETGYLNEYQYPGESFWSPIPDKIEIPHPLGSRAVATGFKVARVIDPIDYKKYDSNYEWFCIKDSQWRTDPVPTRPEYLIRQGGSKKLRKIHVILELDYPYIVHLRNGTKSESNIQESLTPEEPFIPYIPKTPERQLCGEKSQIDLQVSNNSFPSLDIDNNIEKLSDYIKNKTKTLFRQNDKKLGVENVSFTLSNNNWRSNIGNKDAIVYYSRKSNRLVVIPRITVDKYIFDPFFQKNSEGYGLSTNYEAFAISKTDKRINLKFEIKNDRLLVYLKNKDKSIPLISLPKDYWPEILPENKDIKSKIIEEILHICTDFSSGNGIVPIK